MAEKNKILVLINLIKFMSLIVNSKGMMSSDKKTWTYELKSIETESSDHEKLKMDFQIERVSRGVYALSGTFALNFDIAEGDSNNVAAKSFRSSQGDSDYKALPFQMPAAHFYKILNSYYKDVLMETLSQCSDLPTFKDKFEPPLAKKTYTLKSCQFSQDGLPNHLQEGFYKVSIFGTGEVDWKVDIVAEVTPNL